MKIKERKNTITFGGKSIYGTIIDSACERYGWTMQYVVWGISYTNLCMLLADSTKDVYLTDDEMKKYQSSDNTNTISADDIGNMNLILSRSWE